MATHCRLSCEVCTEAAAAGAETSPGEPCTDLDEECNVWAKEGECSANPEYMELQCRMSCGLCGGQEGPKADAPSNKGASEASRDSEAGEPCEDLDEECAVWQHEGECSANPEYMEVQCRKSCGVCRGDRSSPPGASMCGDDDEDCSYWAANGECDSNQEWMGLHCRRSCQLCDAPPSTHNDGSNNKLISNDSNDSIKNNHSDTATASPHPRLPAPPVPSQLRLRWLGVKFPPSYRVSRGDYLSYEIYGTRNESSVAIGVDMLVGNGTHQTTMVPDAARMDKALRLFGAPTRQWVTRQIILPRKFAGDHVLSLQFVCLHDGEFALESRVLIRNIKVLSPSQRLVVSVLPDALPQ